jgi:hypothetical protein
LAEPNDDLADRLYSVLLGHNPCVHGGWDVARAIPGERPPGREADADDLAEWKLLTVPHSACCLVQAQFR